MIVQHFMRVLPDALPSWEALGWRPTVAVWVESLRGFEVLLAWEGDGEPQRPEAIER